MGECKLDLLSSESASHDDESGPALTRTNEQRRVLMNRKQMITLWLMAIALSLVSLAHGLDKGDLFYTFVLPIVLMGGTLLYQLRDRSSSGKSTAEGKVTRLLLLLIGANLLLSAYLLRRGVGIEESVADIWSQTYTIHSQTSSLESDIASVASALEDLRSDVSVLAYSR
jgi:hypothetical protein